MSKPVQTPAEKQIRNRLEARRQELLTRRKRADVDRTHRLEPLAADSSEQVVQLENDEALDAIQAAALREIQGIDEALARLDLGLYGICKACGGGITADRLDAVPHAVICARCAH